MQLSQKQKKFSEISCEFLKPRLKFQHIRKKDHTHSQCISEITDFQKRG